MEDRDPSSSSGVGVVAGREVDEHRITEMVQVGVIVMNEPEPCVNQVYSSVGC